MPDARPTCPGCFLPPDAMTRVAGVSESLTAATGKMDQEVHGKMFEDLKKGLR